MFSTSSKLSYCERVPHVPHLTSLAQRGCVSVLKPRVFHILCLWYDNVYEIANKQNRVHTLFACAIPSTIHIVTHLVCLLQVRPFIEMVIEEFQAEYYPNMNLAIDESMCKFTVSFQKIVNSEHCKHI